MPTPPPTPDIPDLNSPGTFNARVLAWFTYIAVTLRSWLANLSANDWFNVLGPVSFQRGEPSGGIIEQGSGPGGSYVRFADGTQICRLQIEDSIDVLAAEGPLYSSSSFTWTYPAEFAPGGDLVVTGGSNQALTWMTSNNIGLAGANLRLLSTAPGPNRDLRVRAEGRWR